MKEIVCLFDFNKVIWSSPPGKNKYLILGYIVENKGRIILLGSEEMILAKNSSLNAGLPWLLNMELEARLDFYCGCFR